MKGLLELLDFVTYQQLKFFFPEYLPISIVSISDKTYQDLAGNQPKDRKINGRNFFIFFLIQNSKRIVLKYIIMIVPGVVGKQLIF